MKRRTDIDFLRIIASFAVVLLHATVLDGRKIGQWEFDFNALLNALCRFCVPVFVMISGGFLLDRDESIERSLKRTGMSILTMLLWSALYIANGIITKSIDISGTYDVIKYLLSEPVHLWYFWAIATLQLFTPLFRIFVKGAGKKEFKYLLTLTFIFGFLILPTVRTGKAELLASIVDKMKTDAVLGFVWYYFFGFYVMKFGILKRRLLNIAGSLSALVTVVGTLYFSRIQGAVCDTFLSFFSPFVAIYSACVFGSVLGLFEKRESKAVKIISSLTAGIYGVHILVMEYAAKFMPEIAGAGTVLLAVSVYIISAVLVFAVKKICEHTGCTLKDSFIFNRK